MPWWSEFGRRLWMLLHRRRFDRELAEEMRLHSDLRADQPRFGNDLRLREESHDMWGWRLLEELGQDTRHGLRLLTRTPILTTVALLSLTLGIGANTALFSLTDAVLLRSLPVKNPQQLALVTLRSPRAARPSPVFSNPLWEQLRDHQDVFDGVFAWFTTSFNLSQGGELKMVPAVQASGDYFSTLGVTPVIGRLFNRTDDQHGCPAVADISDGFWQSHFGGASSALGTTLQLSGHPFQVIGVTPPGFFGVEVGERFDVAVPLCTEAITEPKSALDEFNVWWLNIMGRVRPGATAGTASARLEALGPSWMAAALPPGGTPARTKAYLERQWAAQPAALGVSGMRTQYSMPLEILLAIAGIVLLVACANLAGLMLARATARRQEIAIRLSLGASRGRLIRQLLTESLLLALGGAGLGAGFAAWICAGTQRYLSSPVRDVSLDLSLDWRVLAFTLGVAAFTGLLVGILPAIRATDVNLAASARPAARKSGRSGLGRNRYVVVTQIALSLVLLAGAGLFLRSFANLLRVNTGFDASHVLLVKLSPAANHPGDAAILAANTATLTRLRRIPGVEMASESWLVPTSGNAWDNGVQVAHGGSSTAAVPDAYFNLISPGYFATLRTSLLSGRDFLPTDTAASPPVMIVNQTLARQLFPKGGAIGQWLQRGDEPSTMGAPTQIVGIAADADYRSLRDAPPPTAYYPLAQLQNQLPTTAYELRSALPPAVLEREVRTAFARFAPNTAFQLETMEGQVASTLKPERLLAILSALFGCLALLLTAIGLYGIMAYLATERRKEFGIRLALGARPDSIRGLVMREAAMLLAWGAGLGAVAAWMAGRLLQVKIGGLLFGLSAGDLATLAYAVLTLAAVALLAAARPAQRAARLNPMQSLREE